MGASNEVPSPARRPCELPTIGFRPLGKGLLMYTDGVVETEDPAGNRLRMDGLRQSLIGPMENAEDLLQKAVSAVNTFRRGEHLRDDLTLVAVHLFARSAALAPIPVVSTTLKTIAAMKAG